MRDRQFFNTQLHVLHSRAIADRVVDRLKLKDQPVFQAASDPVGLLLSAVGVEPVPNAYVVEVRITHNVPEDAALRANTLSDVYMDYSIEGQVEAARRAYRWVTERLAETQEDMQKAQDKLLKSYQGQDLFVPEGSVSAITTSITKLNEDFVQTQGRKITLQSELMEFAGMRARGRDLDAVPQVVSDATVMDLNGKLQGHGVRCLCGPCPARAISTRHSQMTPWMRSSHAELYRLSWSLDL